MESGQVKPGRRIFRQDISLLSTTILLRIAKRAVFCGFPDKAKCQVWKLGLAEVHSRAVRMVLEHGADHASQWAAIGSIAAKIGCTPETLRGWVRQAERNQGLRAGPSSEDRIKDLEPRCANCARPMKSCARRRRILRWRSSTAGPSHDRVHRRSSRCPRGRADLPGSPDPLGWLSTCDAGGTFATLAPSTYHGRPGSSGQEKMLRHQDCFDI
jgi:transposase-like protein